jgi:hypothetical protein
LISGTEVAMYQQCRDKEGIFLGPQIMDVTNDSMGVIQIDCRRLN